MQEHRGRVALLAFTSALSLLLVSGTAGSAMGASVATAGPDLVGPTGDLLITNHSFESGMDGWTVGHADSVLPKTSADCSAVVSISTDQHSTGAASLRLQRSQGCPSPSASSGTFPAQGGREYSAYLVALSSGDGGAKADLVFRDAQQRVLPATPGPGDTDGPTELGLEAEWRTVSARATAPAGTATVSLAVGLVGPAGDSVYVDDALLTGKDTNLGAQMSSASTNAVTFGVDVDGVATGYGVITGNDSHPAHLVGVNSLSGALTVDVELPGATGAWAATTATDGTIYIGSYNYADTTKGGRLFQYTPGAEAVLDLGSPVPGDTFVHALTAGPDGSVFAGTYPSGSAVKFTPGSGFSQVGSRPLVAPEQYARSAAYDPSNDILYVGIGAHAHLMACPSGGTRCTDILPPEYSAEEFTYSVSAGGGYVFANMSPSGNGHLVVLKVTKGADGSVSATAVKDIPTVKYPGASPVINGSVYYVGNNKLSRYDIADNSATSLGRGLPIGPRAWGVDASGANPVLLTMATGPNGPTVVRYDPSTDTLTSVSAPGAPRIPTDIQSIQAGPDGKIYSSFFRSGSVGAYTPIRSDQSITRSGISQAEGSTVIGDTIYWGTYPGANIYAYKPDQPWLAGTNPKIVCSLIAQEQDRPYGMVNADGKLVIGTGAGYGKLTGALSTYDPATGSCVTESNVVPDQTIASLAYLDGKVYAGTSIWGGLGIEPAQREAKLLVKDTATGVSKAVDLPTRGLRTVLALTVGPDHRIWMVAEDHILVYDPVEQRFVVDKLAFPELNIPGAPLVDAHDAFLTVAKDGNLYGTIHSSYLYRLDPKTLKLTILQRAKVHHLTADLFGNLYYVQNGYELRRMVVSEADKHDS